MQDEKGKMIVNTSLAQLTRSFWAQDWNGIELPKDVSLEWLYTVQGKVIDKHPPSFMYVHACRCQDKGRKATCKTFYRWPWGTDKSRTPGSAD